MALQSPHLLVHLMLGGTAGGTLSAEEGHGRPSRDGWVYVGRIFTLKRLGDTPEDFGNIFGWLILGYVSPIEYQRIPDQIKGLSKRFAYTDLLADRDSPHQYKVENYPFLLDAG